MRRRRADPEDLGLPDSRRVLDALCRQELGAFIERSFVELNAGEVFCPNWHFEALAYQLMRVARGEIRRLLITLPPRSLKSLSASIAFPAWLLGRDPTRRIVAVSYASDLATAHANSFRNLVSAPWYRALFPGTRIDPAKDTETETRMTAGGYRLTTTIGGSLTGRGGSVFIIDDPMKAADAASEAARARVKAWFDETLLSRLDHKKTGAIILAMQRLHVDDLAGHVLRKGDWEHLDLPAIAEHPMTVATGPTSTYRRQAGELLHPAREDQAALDELKAAMGSAAFAAQYQQRPVPLSGNMIKWSWFRMCDAPPSGKSARVQVIQSWDTASKPHELADYSVGVTAILDRDDIYIIDVIRKRLDYPDLKRTVIDYAQRWKADSVLIEDKGSGMSLLQDLCYGSVPTIAITPEGDKIVRMSTCTAQIEAGQVHLPSAAAWLPDFRTELLAFPYGTHDDQVDALSQLINWNRTKSTYTLENF